MANLCAPCNTKLNINAKMYQVQATLWKNAGSSAEVRATSAGFRHFQVNFVASGNPEVPPKCFRRTLHV